MWRPEDIDWENPYEEVCANCNHCSCFKVNGLVEAYEAGADAMLKALRKDGIRATFLDRVELYRNGNKMVLCHNPDSKGICTICIIPDKE